jgi:hypothetical protein
LGSIQDQELVLHHKRFRDDGAQTAGPEESGDGCSKVKEQDDQVAHPEILAA